MIRVFCYTCDPYTWCLKPFCYLFNTYWSELQEVIIGGFTPPKFPLPSNYTFHQIDRNPYPKERWSDGLIKFLQDYDDDIFVLMLEDYLLRRTVDHQGIATLAEYMRLKKNEDVVRFDLTNDRLNADTMHDIESYGHYDIIACNKDSMYEMSLQAAIWNRRNLLDLLRPGLNPWEVELQTDMTQQPYRVLGSRQLPLRYANLMLKGSVVDYELDHIPETSSLGNRKLDNKMTMTAYQLSDWQAYMKHSEIDAMQNLAALLPLDAIVVKIGAGAGTDTLAILEVTQDVVIFSIDIAAGEQPTVTNEHLRLAETGDDQTGTVIRIWGDSKIVGLRWPVLLDWLHVDGDHSKEGITGDIKEWFRHVRPGGFISFHDYDDNNWPDVKIVVDRMMQGQEYLPMFSADKFRAYRKRD